MGKDDMIKLVGSYYGIKKIKKYVRQYDIECSMLSGKKYEQNKFSISKKNKNAVVYIYHSYKTITTPQYTGRWYNTNLDPHKDFIWNDATKCITYKIPEYEDEHGNGGIQTKYNVPITICFTNKGWKKLKETLGM